MGMSDPSITYTLDQFIEMQVIDDLTYYNFSIIELIDGIEHLDHNLIEEYIDELENICTYAKMDQEQLNKYRYAPDLLAYDLYGSVQLDFIILLINDMVDPKEFDRSIVKLPYSSSLADFLGRVYNHEYQYLKINRTMNNLPVHI